MPLALHEQCVTRGKNRRLYSEDNSSMRDIEKVCTSTPEYIVLETFLTSRTLKMSVRDAEGQKQWYNTWVPARIIVRGKQH